MAQFLMQDNLMNVICHPMLDIQGFTTLHQMSFYTDVSAGPELGFGCVYGNTWTFGHWERDFIKVCKPSIAFLELYALCVDILMWQTYLKNCQIIIHCDDQSVVQMVNEMGSKCKKMYDFVENSDLEWFDPQQESQCG